MGEKDIGWGLPTWTIWLGLAVIAFFVYLVRAILPPFLVGAFIAFVLSPIVARLQDRWGLSRPVAIGAVYLSVVGPIVLAAALGGHRFLDETRQLIVNGPAILTTLIENVFGPGPYDVFGTTLNARQITFNLLGSIRDSIATPGAVVRLLSGFSEAILNLFLTILVSIYLLGDGARVGSVLLSIAPPNRRPHVLMAVEEIHRTLARFFRRQLLLVALVSTATFIGLELIFRLHYALPLAIATGFLEIIPFIGPVTAATVAALIALSQGGIGLVLGILAFYTVLRQIEDQIVSPVVLGNAVELHPLIVIFAVVAGGALFGVLGTLAAIPIAAAIKVMVDYAPRLISGPPTAIATVHAAPIVDRPPDS